MMIPAIAILIFAWSLKGMGDALEISTFVKNIVGSNASASVILPAILFVVAVFLSFSTGTSWGTFAILVPIAIAMFPGSENLQMMIISVSAVLAGAVCGDHVSPISDTTVMSSAGAQSNHINHVTTQMQYAKSSCSDLLYRVYHCRICTYLVGGSWNQPDPASAYAYSDQKSHLPKKRRQKQVRKIQVPYIDQSIKYPTGCESVSAVMLLKYLGYEITVDEFIQNCLECREMEIRDGVLYGPDPNKFFCEILMMKNLMGFMREDFRKRLQKPQGIIMNFWMRREHRQRHF